MTSLHYYLFLCVCVFFLFFSPVRLAGFSIFHIISFIILSAQNKLHLSQKSCFGGFSPKIRRGKKSFVLALSLCRSRQILGYICRPIKGSQLTPHIQVRLTFLPCTIHVFLFKQISCLQSVVCEYIPLFYGFFFFFFFTLCNLSPLNFPALKML